MTITRAEAVRSDWLAIAPPIEGWQSVSVPDVWTSRWPEFEGVVWYRLEWDQTEPLEPVGLALEYVRMAGEVSINGTMLHRDENLVEPLTRAWNVPRFWVVAPPLLRAGKNTMLVRVSGYAAYRGGLGPVTVGPRASVQAIHKREEFLRQDVKLFMGAITAALSCIFLILWCLRRTELAFGWFGLNMLMWFIYTSNLWVTSPWPFASTHTFQAVRVSVLLLFASTLVIFVLRFCERRFPRLEKSMWMLIAALIMWALIAPHDPAQLYRALFFTLVAFAITVAAALSLIVFAWRSNQIEQRILSATSVLYIVAATHDVLAFATVLRSNFYYFDLTVTFTALAIFWVLALRYSRNLKRIENFNSELRSEINAARIELSLALRQQHDTEMTHARIGERLSLVQDIHDGLGGTLVGSIAAIEHAPQNASAPYLLGLLKALRDDLRLIIDSTADRSEGNAHLDEQLAPIRHRMTRLLDASNIKCDWDVAGIDKLTLPYAKVLDVLRFLQEALTNVLKHSGATRVTARVRAEANELQLEVIDNGSGIEDPVTNPQACHGAGMRNMQARAQRLGGQWRVQSSPGQTTVAIYHVAVKPR